MNDRPKEEKAAPAVAADVHPVVAGVGAMSGAVAGAAIGAPGGAVTAALGAAVGAVAGAIVGEGVADAFDHSVEETYWRRRYATAVYANAAYDFSDFSPAYRYGWERRAQAGRRPFSEVENDLARDWETSKGSSRLTWDKARAAVREAWQRAAERIDRVMAPTAK